MRSSFTTFLVTILGLSIISVAAPLQLFASSTLNDAISTYRSISTLTSDQIQDASGSDSVNRASVEIKSRQKFSPLLIEKNTKRIMPYQLTEKYELNNTSYSTEAININDRNFNTYTEFVLDSNAFAISTLELELDQPTSLDSLSVYLDTNVALPNTITVESEDTTLLNKASFYGNTITFPRTTVSNLTIQFEHDQLLRINELELGTPTRAFTSSTLTWLAQPDQDYTLYTDGVVVTNTAEVQPSEAPNFNAIEDTIAELGTLGIQENSTFKELDIDEDSIVDAKDNCPSIANSEQEDFNSNGTGDACEDSDGDSIKDGLDNCVNLPNRLQTDTDKNKVGDICEDEDLDEVPNGIDNCPSISNPDQRDQDGDQLGDACDDEESRFFEREDTQGLIWLIVGVVLAIMMGISVLAVKRSGNTKNS